MNSRTTPDAVQTQDLRPHRLRILSPHNSARSAVETGCLSQRRTAETAERAEDAEKAGSLNNARGPMMKPRTTPDGTQTQASGLSSAPYPSPHNSARSAVETACRSQRGTAETPRAGTRSEIRRVNSTPIPDGLRVDAERHSVPRSLPARSGYRWSATSSVSRRCGSDNTSPAISRIFVKRYRSVL